MSEGFAPGGRSADTPRCRGSCRTLSGDDDVFHTFMSNLSARQNRLGRAIALAKLVWILKFRQWFCRPSFETALAPEEIPWRIGGNSSPLFPLVVFILPSDDQGGLNERGEGRALTPLCPMVKDYPQSFFGMKPSKTPHIRFFINNFLVPNQPPKD